MKTIGKIIKESRVKKKYSRKKLESQTKIKKEFIKAIEEEDWNALPEPPVLVGFVKNIASALSLNQRQVVAILRRDYPPRSQRINPKPDVESKLAWSPRLTFLLGVIVASLIIVGYLGFQYVNFITPPNLNVEFPAEDQVITQETLEVSGETDPEATIRVNNQPVIVNDDGKFTTEIEIFEGTKEVIVVARSRSGKETTVVRKIKVEVAQ
jgi:cytoskeletal protein RodZ